jgi:2-polyprenyl-3-methyl-5-hydroxy-6-metoxy-1,4-benzoquinol methylase
VIIVNSKDHDLKEYVKSVEEYSDPHWLEEVSYFCSNLDRVESNSILDVGCGLGYVLRSLIKKNRLLVGLDVNRRLVNRAKTKSESSLCHFLVADAKNLPFLSDSFDHVFMIEVIEHLINPNEALNECARVLRRRGRLTLTTPNGFYYRLLHHRSLVSPYHVDEYGFKEIIRLVISAGFSLSCLRVSNRSWGKSLLRVMGRVPILSPLIPGRFYIDARKQ